MLSRSSLLAFKRAARSGIRSYNLRICAALSTAAEAAQAQQDGGSAATWSGLSAWRSQHNPRRRWGAKGPEPAPAVLPPAAAASAEPMPTSLAAWGRLVLLTADPREKAALTHVAFEAFLAGGLEVGQAPPVELPARPQQPQLVPPRQIPSMKNSPLPLNIYQLHNLAHVELNAIDLAWDTLVRFAPLRLPRAFYADFARLADDEARHLEWCLQRMGELGHSYGDMPAHNLLWEGAMLSAHDLGARLAVVPMSQEARGLDAGARLAERLVGWGDNRSAAIVAQIAEEEKAHVAVGVAWFRWICAALGADPGPQYRSLLAELCPDLLKGHFNDEARQEVGLEREWYDVSVWPEQQRGEVEQRIAAARQRERQQAQATAAPAEAGLPAAAQPASSPAQQQVDSTGGGASSGDRAAAGSRALLARAAASDVELQQLRQRLEQLLSAELQASSP